MAAFMKFAHLCTGNAKVLNLLLVQVFVIVAFFVKNRKDFVTIKTEQSSQRQQQQQQQHESQGRKRKRADDPESDKKGKSRGDVVVTNSPDRSPSPPYFTSQTKPDSGTVKTQFAERLSGYEMALVLMFDILNVSLDIYSTVKKQYVFFRIYFN